MSRTLFHHVAPVLLLSLAFVLSGAPFEMPTENQAAAGLGLLCEPQNDDGCQLTDFVCNGYNCCCVYTCSGGTDVGPCQSSGFPGFPAAPSWAQ